MIRDRGLLEIEMYKRARLRSAAEAVFCPFFVVLRSLWARYFFHGCSSYLQNQLWLLVSELCHHLPSWCPKPPLLSSWPGVPTRSQNPRAELAARENIGDTEPCTLTPCVDGAFHPCSLLPPVGFPHKTQLFIISIQDE